MLKLKQVSDKINIEYGVPQGLIYYLTLIQCDNSEIAGYADDTTPYSCADNIQ